MKTLELNPDSPDYAFSFGNVLKVVGEANKRAYGVNPYKVSKSQSDLIKKENKDVAYIEANLEILQTYWYDNIQEGVLDDDIENMFNSWVETTPNEQLIAIIDNKK